MPLIPPKAGRFLRSRNLSHRAARRSGFRARCAPHDRSACASKPAERKPIVRLPKPEDERGRRQERQGTVVSSAMDKTIVVKVD